MPFSAVRKSTLKVFLVIVVILNLIDKDIKTRHEKAPCKDFPVNQTIKKLIQSFQNNWSIYNRNKKDKVNSIFISDYFYFCFCTDN